MFLARREKNMKRNTPAGELVEQLENVASKLLNTDASGLAIWQAYNVALVARKVMIETNKLRG
jgi:hypothetical protein